jgi:hypothetical protein
MPSEKRIRMDVTEWLEDNGALVIKLHGNPMMMAGLPDLLVVIDGLAWFIELKVPGKGATRIQARIHARLRKAGAHCIVAHSLEEVQEYGRHHKLFRSDRGEGNRSDVSS